MDIEKDHYATLGVPPTASHDDIKSAYRAKALRVHPDRGGTGHVMRQLNEAWDILGNPDLRREYDTARAPAAPPPPSKPPGIPEEALPEHPLIAFLGKLAQRFAYALGALLRWITGNTAKRPRQRG